LPYNSGDINITAWISDEICILFIKRENIDTVLKFYSKDPTLDTIIEVESIVHPIDVSDQ